MRRIGVLAPSTRAKEETTLKPFFDGMRELGWVEGQTIAYDRAYADDRRHDLPRGWRVIWWRERQSSSMRHRSLQP